MDDNRTIVPGANASVNPTVTIGGMRLTLPANYVGRAGMIARQVASELSRMPPARSGRIQAISLPAITVQPGETDAALALRIARAIHAEIGRALGGPGMPTGAVAAGTAGGRTPR